MKKLLFLLAVMLIAVGISVAQTDQNNSGNTANSPTATQSTTGAQGSATTPDQGTATQSSTDQTTTTTTHKHKGANGGNLPQTASPLPLLGLLGMGSLAAGVVTRKKKR